MIVSSRHIIRRNAQIRLSAYFVFIVVSNNFAFILILRSSSLPSKISTAMGANRIGSYIVNYRSKRKEAADEERRRRDEELGRRPEIIDPSFELFGQRGQQQEQSQQSPFQDANVSQMSQDDWTFQNRRANTSPEQYQLEPYCEVTPKSSISSTASKASTAPSQNYDMSWDNYSQAKPRPQSYLPPVVAEPQPTYSADSDRTSSYQSRRNTMQPFQAPLPRSSTSPNLQTPYQLGASLTKPFSMDEPLDFWSEPEGKPPKI